MNNKKCEVPLVCNRLGPNFGKCQKCGLPVAEHPVADHAAEIERLSKEITELKLKVAPECYWDDETRYDSAEEYAEEMGLKVGDEFELQAASYWGERLRVIQIPRPVRDDDIGGGEYICETIETVRPTFEEYWKLLARAEAAESKLSQLQLSLREAVNGYEPLREFVGKIADEYDSEEPYHQMYVAARDMSAHITGVKIGIEQSLGGDPMAGPIKLTAILNGDQQ